MIGISRRAAISKISPKKMIFIQHIITTFGRTFLYLMATLLVKHSNPAKNYPHWNQASLIHHKQ